MRWSRSAAILLAALAANGAASARGGAQALETESARFLRAGSCEVATAFEFQTSKEGTERALPMAAEYGVSDRLSLLIEPVAYTSIRPRRGLHATGSGDVEMTAFYLLHEERGRSPAFAVALEAKLPTNDNLLITTAEEDFTGYLIASRRAGRFDLHANAGYTVFGQPPRARLNNVFNGALAAEYHGAARWMLFAEVLGNTSSAPEGGGDNPANPNVVIPEAAGGELVGTVGLGVSPARSLLLSLGVSYDNNNAVMLRPGFAWRPR